MLWLFFCSRVTNQNFGLNNRAWAASPATIEKLAQVQKIFGSNFPSFIYDADSRTIAGCPVTESGNLASSNQMIFGKWDELAIAIWGGYIDMIADPFTMASQNIVRSGMIGYALLRDDRLTEKSRIAPTVTANSAIPGPASGTATSLLWPFWLPLFCPPFPLPLSVPAKARIGRITEAVTNAQSLPTREDEWR